MTCTVQEAVVHIHQRQVHVAAAGTAAVEVCCTVGHAGM